MTVPQLHGHATYYFAVTAYNSSGLSSLPSNEVSYQIPLPVPDIRPGAFVESDGLVVMEAENYQKTTSASGHSWVRTNNLAGFVGTSAMLAAPNAGANIGTDITNTSPGLTYPIQLTRTGVYKFWVRGWAAGGSDDSVYLGLDGLVLRSLSYTQTAAWTWMGVTVIVTSPGLHEINLWIREDGAYVDRLLLTTNMAFVPTGDGPRESAQTGTSLNLAPVVQITTPAPGASFPSGTTVSVSADASDPDDPVAAVELYVNGTLVMSDTSAPYNFAWTPATGSYRLTVLARDDAGNSATSAPIDVTIVASAPGGTFVESDGLVVVEAEHYQITTSASGHSWVPASNIAGFVGASAMLAAPNTGMTISTDITNTSPGLTYSIQFTRTGIYKFWIRGWAAGGSDDSVYMGIDGRVLRNLSYAPSGVWTWMGLPVNVTSPGLHEVNLWLREDGAYVDRLLLTTNLAFVPTGEGPQESARSATSLNLPPVVQITVPAQGSTFPSSATVSVSADASDPDGTVATVEFYVNGALMATATNSPFGVDWSPAPGGYELVAVATDNLGTAGNSPPVNVTITPPSAPVLSAQTNQTIAELATLVVTNTAVDPDLPANRLSYALQSGPENAVISAEGVITWSPSEAQGPSTNVFTTVVSDDGSPPLSATNTFVVIVTEANSAPVLAGQIDMTIAELTTVIVTNTAVDPDLPANRLSYALQSGPENAAISVEGVITWTPTEAQGPSTNVFTTVVSDDGSPPLSATNTFIVIVTEANSAPVLAGQIDMTIAELATLILANTAVDPDLPANRLSYALQSGPENAAISNEGVITWTPTEAQSPITNVFTTVVSDDGSPPLSATNTFVVMVTEANSAPVLVGQIDMTIAELATLIVNNTAVDPDLPANRLSYALQSGPENAVISAEGVITWTPSEAQGPITNVFTTVVSDDGSPPLIATNTFVVMVTEANSAPVLAGQIDMTIAELATLIVTNTAVDPDLPANRLSYALQSGPENAVISAEGVITWTPTEAQGPSTNVFTTVVSDDGSPPLSATNTFVVMVTEANSAPVLAGQIDTTIAELATLIVTNTAVDPDLPANRLSYALQSGPENAAISAEGVITWTPTEAQGPSTNVFTTVVSDDGSPSLSATNTFVVMVTEANSAPVLAGQIDTTIAELATLIVTNTAVDQDLPANRLSYALQSGPENAAISAEGVITWTPTEAQGPSTNVFTTVVSDDGSPGLSATNTFVVIVTEANSAPVLAGLIDMTIAELTTLIVTNTAVDQDLPANRLSYALQSGPENAAISNEGVITWSPSEAQGPSTNVFTTVVSDDGSPGLSATNTFVVIVTEANSAPVLADQIDMTIAELTTVIVTNKAVDPDLPANRLSYALQSGPENAVVSAEGVITWTPSEAQGPSTNVFTTVVSDDGSPGLSATNSFVVIVTEANSAPVLAGQIDLTIAELTTLIVTNTAADPDLPANRLSYALQSGPENAVVSAEGVIIWSPSEAQGPSTNVFTTVVSDDGSPPLSVTNTFVVVVTEVNSAPALSAQNDVTVSAFSDLQVTNTATDVDIPANLLTYALVSAPSNAVISAEGIISWTPGAGQSPSTNVFSTVVADNGVPGLRVTNSFTVFVLEPQRIVLQIHAGDRKNMILSWSSRSPNWVLQESATLEAPDWVNNTNSVQPLGGHQYQVVLPDASRTTFFRLIQP